MRSALLAATLCALTPLVTAEGIESCITKQAGSIGVQELPNSSGPISDLIKIQESETETNRLRLSEIEMCMNNGGTLASLKSTLALVPLSFVEDTTFTQLSTFGDVTANSACETLSFDIENGEYLSQIDMTYIPGQYIKILALETNKGNKLEKGGGTSQSNWENVKLTFTEKTMPVGFYGDAGAKFFQTLGGIVVPEDCHQGQEELEFEFKEDLSESDNKTTLIVAIVAPIVFLLLIGAIIGFVCFKKNQQAKEKNGVEVVAVTKTRPSTPPSMKKTLEKEPVVQNMTDEEELASQGIINTDKPDYIKQQSQVDKPDANI